LHGVTEDIYLSLPCVVGENGITHIIKQQLTDDECAKFRESAKAIQKIQQDIKL
jgi:L-lactate dehydrogenase